MSLGRKWVARCDALGCDAQIVFWNQPVKADLWDTGELLNDAGWQAGPGDPRTFCPLHWQDDWDEETPEQVRAREQLISSGAAQLSAAVADMDRRTARRQVR